MKKQTILLIVIAIFCISVPFVGSMIDFGGGSDDKGGEMVEMINPSYKAKPMIETFTPSDTQETFLFMGQILIGIVVFAVAYYYLIHKNKKEDSN